MAPASSSYAPPRTAVIKWFADVGKDISPEMRSRLVASPFGSVLPMFLGSINSFTVTMVAFYRSGSPLLLTFAILECALLLVRVLLLKRTGKPADPLFAGGLAWVVLQAATIWVVVTSADSVMMVVVLATSLAVLGGIIARNFATPRYAFAQVLAIDLTFKTAFLTLNPTFAPLIVVQTLMFMAYNISILKQHREVALRALRAEIESREQAFTDPLTKLLNRRGLDAAASRMAATETSLVLFYIDLDGFKGVNDRSGHAAGDSVLEAVGDRLRVLLPEGAAISRLGGDEFLVLISMASDEEIRSCGARIVAALSVPYRTEDDGIALIGASVGAARWDESGAELESCMAGADGALYAAKAEGRGRCILAQPKGDNSSHREIRAAAA